MGETEDFILEPVPAEIEPEAREQGMAAGIGRSLLRALWDVVSTVLPAVFMALFINVFVAQAMVVQGPSMQPNLYYDQRVMVEKVTYRFVHGPRRGDVVIVDLPDEEEPLIKRVVALSGEMVEVRGGGRSLLTASCWRNPGCPNREAPITRRRSCHHCTSLSWATTGAAPGIPVPLAPCRWIRSSGGPGSSIGRWTRSSW